MGIGVISPHGQRQVQMADEAQTQELPADGPWSKGWAEVSKAAGNFSEAVETAVSGVKDAVASVKLPWESSADELAAQTKNVRPPLPDLPKSQQNAPMGFQSLFNRLVDTESAGQHTNASGALLTSSKGAQGITQVMPKTAANPGFGVTPIQNNSAQEYLRFGKDYLSALIKNYGGDQTKAVAAYNYGPGAVDRAVAKAEKKGGDWLSFTPAETQKYVQRILGGNQISAENRGGDRFGDPDNRPVYESLPTITGKELAKSPMLTDAGRKQWLDDIQTKYDASLKGMTAKQKDKYFSNALYWAQKNDPKNYSLYQAFRGKGDISDAALSFLDSKNPKVSFTNDGGETMGFVYSGNGDRVFLNGGADFNTLVHETEHLQQQADYRDKGLNSSAAQLGMVGNWDEPNSKLRKWAYDNRNDPAVKEVFRASNAWDSTGEYLANLEGFWKTGIPKGKSWSDTEFYKKLEKDVGKEQAQTMMLDSLATLTRHPSTEGRVKIRMAEKK